jgi:hypothetical protein
LNVENIRSSELLLGASGNMTQVAFLPVAATQSPDFVVPLMKFEYAFLCVGGLATHGFLKKSLSLTGIVAAGFVGLITFSQEWTIFTAVLLAFYLSSTRLTKARDQSGYSKHHLPCSIV